VERSPNRAVSRRDRPITADPHPRDSTRHAIIMALTDLIAQTKLIGFTQTPQSWRSGVGVVPRR
jgi:hypothetical protein